MSKTPRDAAATIEGPSVMSLFLRMTTNGGVPLADGTGFLWQVGQQTFLVTNWHNLAGRRADDLAPMHSSAATPDALQMSMLGATIHDHITVTVPLLDQSGEPLWFEHPVHGRKVDVAALPIDPSEFPREVTTPPLLNGTEVAGTFELYPGTDLYVVGYPFGIRPGGFTAIWVRGTIASEPDVDFNGLPCFLIDARTRTGQSGSPVLEHFPHGVVPGGGGWEFRDGPVTRVHGVYSGRTDQASDLGLVWKASAVVEILTGRRRAAVA